MKLFWNEWILGLKSEIPMKKRGMREIYLIVLIFINDSTISWFSNGVLLRHWSLTVLSSSCSISSQLTHNTWIWEQLSYSTTSEPGSEGRFWKRITKDDAQIDWKMTGMKWKRHVIEQRGCRCGCTGCSIISRKNTKAQENWKAHS